MAKRKVKVVYDEVVKAAQKLEEAQILLKQAEAEEKSILENATSRVQSIAEEGNLFIGLIITKADLLGIMDLYLDTKEPVQVPFRVYPKE